mmetsp:Transcript_40418/g.92788  ORF Transcript_40418/g.92788 Transcript_40418/m.92788 type:complete len:195 (-) Transcript_40418:196-780(-)
MEYKIAVGEMTAAPLVSQKSTDTEQRNALKRFEKMLAMGIPQDKVKERMLKAGVEPNLMERIGFLPCLKDQQEEWQGIYELMKAEVDKQLPYFEEGAKELSELESTMHEIDKERPESAASTNPEGLLAKQGTPEYWQGGEGAAGDLTPAALKRLRARLEVKRMELDGLMESPTPDWSFFVGRPVGEGDPADADY